MCRVSQFILSDSNIWNLAWERNFLEMSVTYFDPVKSSLKPKDQSTNEKESKCISAAKAEYIL